MRNLVPFFIAVLWFTLVLGRGIQRSFCEGFSVSSLRTRAAILGNAEGCGIQHSLFCLFTMDWKYDFCRYQFVVNTFFIWFTSILYLFLLYLRFTHIQYVLFQTNYIVIQYTHKYKPSHTSHINKHTQCILTTRNVIPNSLHNTEKRAGHKNNSHNHSYTKLRIPLEIIT